MNARRADAGGAGDEPAAWVLHVDLDQFVAAVEVLRHPELRGRPVVVGGNGDPVQRRQVVATASYEARAFGVRSGMPLSVAARRCPDATFLPTDHQAYERASRQVMAALRGLPVVVEELGWDEAFLGSRPGPGDPGDPVALARRVRRTVAADTGLACSVGIGDTRLQAKLATGFAKPGGIHRLTTDSWLPTMSERSTRALWGIGPRMAERLAALGLHTVAELAAADEARLVEAFGSTAGPYYRDLGRGGSDAHVDPEPRERRSRSREVTFATDLDDDTEVHRELSALARELTLAAAGDERLVARVAVKVRIAPYLTTIKVSTLPAPTDDPALVTTAAIRVLTRFGALGPVRLLGVRVDYSAGADRSAPDGTST